MLRCILTKLTCRSSRAVVWPMGESRRAFFATRADDYQPELKLRLVFDDRALFALGRVTLLLCLSRCWHSNPR